MEKHPFKVLRLREGRFGFFGKRRESALLLRDFLKKHFGELPEGFGVTDGIMGHLYMEGDEALQWWSDNVSNYVHGEGATDGKFWLTTNEIGVPLLAPNARVEEA